MPISAQFQADFTSWTASVNDAEGQLVKLRSTSDTIGPSMQRQAEQVGRDIVQLGRDVTDLSSQWIAAYAADEAATAQLTTALQQQGIASQQVKADYAAMATEFQNTTRFADDAVTRSQAVFTAIGKVGPENMRAAMDAATNLAAFMKTDLETAATVVAKAFGTGGDSLGKLKQLLGDTVPKGAEMSDVLAAINAKFGGQAAADMETTNGKLAALKNQFGDVQEQMGALLVKGLTPILNAFTSLPEPVQTFIATVGVLGVALAPIAIAIGSIVTAIGTFVAAAGGVSVVIGGIGAAFTALLPFLGPAGLIVGGIVAVYLAFQNWDKIVEICQRVYNGIKTWLVDNFKTLVGYILQPTTAVVDGFKWMYDKVVGHSIVPDMIDGIAANFAQLPDVMTKPTQQAAADVTAALQAAADAWQSSPFNRMARNFMTILTDSGGVARDMFGRPVAVDIPGGVNLARSLGHQNVQVAVYGSVLSTKSEIAGLVGDALTSAYRQGGNRLPA